MKLFEGTTADEVWQKAADCLLTVSNDTPRDSRSGVVIEALHVGFTIENPRERWVLNRMPALNPAFAIAEVAWILSGRSDSSFLTFFNSKLANYVGSDPITYGAYGQRLRSQLGFDQLDRAHSALRATPTSRQVVLQIWDGRLDMPNDDGSARAPDIPCNVVSMLRIVDSRLEWMQVMRSNDIFKGTPYNFIQFTTLQEIMAGWLDVEVGTYNHMSDSLHMYVNEEKYVSKKTEDAVCENKDTLALPKDLSEREIKALCGFIDRFISESLTEQEIYGILLHSGMTPGFHNLLTVLVAETARRRRWPLVTAKAMKECSNPVLIQAWDRWSARMIDTKRQNAS